MALVLKSNVALDPSVKPLGDKHGVVEIVDWKYMLDFENQEYVSRSNNQKQSHEFSDLIDFTRNTTAELINQSGNPETVAANVPRISKIQNKMGLLIESGRFNYFLNSNTPATQEVSGFTTGATVRLICIVEGTGTVTISGTGVTAFNAIASAGNPAVISIANQSGSASITATVSGNVIFCQICQERGGVKETSRIHTTTRTVGINSDEVKLKQLITDALTSNFTVLMQSVRQPYMLYKDISDFSSVAEVSGTSNSNITIGFHKAGGSIVSTASNRLRSFVNGSEGLISIAPALIQQPITFALTVSDSASWSRNGVNLGKQDFKDGFRFEDLRLGASSWLGSSGYLDGIITKLVIYDRVLSDSELQVVSRSFL